MREYLKKLPFTIEFITVISLCFGYSIFGSVVIFINLLLSNPFIGIPFSNATIISTVIYEIIILITIYYFLKTRDNSIELKNNTNILSLIGFSILLLIVYYAIYFIIINSICYLLSTDNLAIISHSYIKNGLNIYLIFILSIVNPVFEETIVVGYVITVLSSRKSNMYAINVSVLIRMLYHLYQGPIGAITMIPMGLIFAFAYVKWKNIWPLIIAHGILDFVGLYSYGL